MHGHFFAFVARSVTNTLSRCKYFLRAGFTLVLLTSFAATAYGELIIAPPGSLSTLEGARLVETYGSFSLYDLPVSSPLPEGAYRLGHGEVRTATRHAPSGELLRSSLVDEGVPEDLIADDDAAGLHVVRFVGPARPAWLDTLRAVGLTPIRPVPAHAHLVWVDAEAATRLADLAAIYAPIVDHFPHHPFLRLDRTLQTALRRGDPPSTQLPVVIQVYRHPTVHHTQRAVENAIRAVGVSESATGWTSLLEFRNRRASLDLARIRDLVRRPDVLWIGVQPQMEPFDEVQTQILAGDFDAGMSGPDAPGYLAFLQAKGFSLQPEDYAVLDVTDDGVGDGDGTVDSGDPTFHVFGSEANPSRLAYVTSCTNLADGGSRLGHGHINLSIAGGFDARPGPPFQDPLLFQRGLGVNPFGRFASSQVFKSSGVFDLTRCGLVPEGLITATARRGTRLVNNSWGCRSASCQSTYNEFAQVYDAGTRDGDPTEPGWQQMLHIFSAGNSGPGAATIDSPGNAKNVLTVGASENDRPSDEDGPWTDGCGVGPGDANDAMEIAGFSSRGPAPGERAKPDLVAPGTHVHGTASPHLDYIGGLVCDIYRPDDQTMFAGSSGTSHAAPAVAGAVTLADWWLRRPDASELSWIGGQPVEPSPALLKAYLASHTTYLTGFGAGDSLPSPGQGFGMPNLDRLFDDDLEVLLDQTVTFDHSGDRHTLQVEVADPLRPMTVALAFTDAPGTLGFDPQINDLDLSVVVDGVTYHGNVFSGRWSASGGSPDRFNNLEIVALPSGTSGNLWIEITGFEIAGNGLPGVGDETDQDFALVCSNCQSVAAFELRVPSGRVDICQGETADWTVAVDAILGFDGTVSLSVADLPTGASAGFVPNPVPAGKSSQLTLTDTGSLPEGDQGLLVVGQSGTLEATAFAPLRVASAVPTAPIPFSPTGGTQVTLQPTLVWTPSSQAAGYLLEVALDPAFDEIVYSASVGDVNIHTLSAPLAGSTVHHWRLRAENSCGTSASSISAVFETLPSLASRIVYQESFEDTVAGLVFSDLREVELATANLQIISVGDDLATAGPLAVDRRGLVYIAQPRPFSALHPAMILQVNPRTGDQRIIAQGLALPTGPSFLAFDPDADRLLLYGDTVGNPTSTYHWVDRNTGAVTPVAGLDGFDGRPLRLESGGRLYFTRIEEVTKPQLISIGLVDVETGDEEIITLGGDLGSPIALEIDADGDLLVFDPNAFPDNCNGEFCETEAGILRVDPATGEQTTLSRGGLLEGGQPWDLLIDPSGPLVVRISFANNGSFRYRFVLVDLISGEQTLAFSIPIEWGPSRNLVVLPEGVLFVDGFEAGDPSAWSSANDGS